MSSIFQGVTGPQGAVELTLVSDPDAAAPENYFRGLAMGSDGRFLASTTDTAEPAYVAGLRCSKLGVLILSGAGAVDGYAPGAAPQTGGRLKMAIGDAPDHAHQGVGYTGAGSDTAISAEETPPPTGGAFDSGFDEGFDIA